MKDLEIKRIFGIQWQSLLIYILIYIQTLRNQANFKTTDLLQLTGQSPHILRHYFKFAVSSP